MVLNAKTGLAKASTGRENTIVIPESYHGLTGKSVIFYLFLPSNEESMEITASAVDENGEAFIKRNCKMKWRKTANSREEMPEYVERSYQEALVNALAHRDYLVIWK